MERRSGCCKDLSIRVKRGDVRDLESWCERKRERCRTRREVRDRYTS